MLADRKSSGYSMIELVISLGLLSIIGYGIAGMCSRQSESGAMVSARSLAQKDIDHLLAYIKRDAKLQAVNGVSVTADGTGIQIQRIAPHQTNPNVIYKVLFQSSCIPFTAEQTSFLAAYGPSFRQLLYAAPNVCLSKINCSAGSFPGIRITTEGTNPLVYRPVLPEPGRSVLAGPSGLAMCVQQSGDQLLVRVETVLTQKVAETLVPRVISKLFYLPLLSNPDLVLIPN
ncbi:MAG: hypothetical protein M3Q07_14190 [Pseudobdellovibrionaceae bacterium]|nr:hypothetical protein [Pseudobdellovibrionaceae bacterium]